ncbi:MAG: response regulator transcription factor [Bacteroidota bacterium]|nr:response regulator transcription factor [Bacteroidota bacterium]MDP4248253.1 response regulator transcription factor [Bacteroidota bacterium]MDP4256506.1 response regulator transcription factor [Bacteroidota bacterium]MDP4259595.1 response regulator transcription factor [Bacteroidota bacterium]
MRILIADDHTVVRKGLRQILKEEFLAADIVEVADADDLFNLVIRETWDVVISDISMPGRSGLEVLQQIRQNYPKLPVLILSVHPEEQYAVRVLKAGASGYLNKDSAENELVKAVRCVLLGKKYITHSLAEKIAESIDQEGTKWPHEYLSDREFEVFKLLSAGRSVSEIGEKLSLSATTISTYRARIMTKMNVRTNADLTLYAIEHKLL